MNFPKSNKSRAFTLLELLSAVAVLALALYLLLQISGQTLNVTRSSHDKMESAHRARAVLDALSIDFANRVEGTDFPIFTKDQNGNRVLTFLTRSRGPAGSLDFRYLAVAYELSGNQILRRTADISWNQADPAILALSAVTSQTFSVVADGILRFEAVAVLDDGTLTTLIPDSGKTWMTETWRQAPIGSGFQALLPPTALQPYGSSSPRAAALIFGVAALDQKNLRKIADPQTDLADKLLTPIEGSTPIEVWNAAGNLNGLPSETLSSLLLSQEIYVLH